MDLFRDDAVGAAMFDHVVTRPLLASAASVFTMDLYYAGAASQTFVSGNIVGGDWVDDTKLWSQLQGTWKSPFD